MAVASACGGAKPEAADDRVGLAFTRYLSAEDSSVWVADEDGSNARQIAADAFAGTLSPDGRRLAYSAPQDIPDSGLTPLYVADVGGGKSQRIGEASGYAWSPDGGQLAVSDGEAWFLLEVESGKRRLTLSGNADGFNFAPDGKFLAYTRGNGRVGHEYRSDVFVVRLSDGKTEQLTHDGHSDSAVWGREWIAYRRFRFEDEGWPKIGELRLMRSDGSGDRLFARGDENTSEAHYGLEPLEFSADGKRLLACNVREFSCPPVTFTVPHGEQHEFSVDDEPGMVAYAADLARDGSEVLVDVGPFDGPMGHRVYVIPFEGGIERLLVKDASSPSWAR